MSETTEMRLVDLYFRKFSSLTNEDHKILFVGIEPILSTSATLTTKVSSDYMLLFLPIRYNPKYASSDIIPLILHIAKFLLIYVMNILLCSDFSL